ncbi:DUF397 domain-containing protein [Nocardiopsis tropica]|uniref:DUF397 domain-containing protein n=1 Tax=Nocardiopsis tropica TaxID=109330 RepID=UPI002E82DEC1|nr:DUF397 domain-containing protein [Nocardiopsis tropica]
MTADWFKSSYSANSGACVEARLSGIGADVRDTQNRDAGTLSFPSDEWRALLAAEAR